VGVGNSCWKYKKNKEVAVDGLFVYCVVKEVVCDMKG